MFSAKLERMKIALVHDYIKEFGGAERVLRVLSEMYPEAPIYTAFRTPNSTAANEFADKKIIESKWGWLLRYGNLHSPLRFLLPWIWESLDLSGYDLVITSCSGYIARGFKTADRAKVVAYCHTPPRFLYGYETSLDWQRHWPVRAYAAVVNHFLRQFDFRSAQRVDHWLVNSQSVKRRVAKFYRQEAMVIYPPVATEALIKASQKVIKEDYFLIASRLVGAKGLIEAVKAAKHLAISIKIAGGAEGYSGVKDELLKIAGGGVELLCGLALTHDVANDLHLRLDHGLDVQVGDGIALSLASLHQRRFLFCRRFGPRQERERARGCGLGLFRLARARRCLCDGNDLLRLLLVALRIAQQALAHILVHPDC